MDAWHSYLGGMSYAIHAWLSYFGGYTMQAWGIYFGGVGYTMVDSTWFNIDGFLNYYTT